VNNYTIQIRRAANTEKDLEMIYFLEDYYTNSDDWGTTSIISIAKDLKMPMTITRNAIDYYINYFSEKNILNKRLPQMELIYKANCQYHESHSYKNVEYKKVYTVNLILFISIGNSDVANNVSVLKKERFAIIDEYHTVLYIEGDNKKAHILY
jgi:hypothetical protein